MSTAVILEAEDLANQPTILKNQSFILKNQEEIKKNQGDSDCHREEPGKDSGCRAPLEIVSRRSGPCSAGTTMVWNISLADRRWSYRCRRV
jgi:hypothetical protein